MQQAYGHSPCAMEISPLPSQPAQAYLSHHEQPGASFHPRVLSPTLANHQRTSTSDSSSNASSRSGKSSPRVPTTTTTHKSFDQSFFSKLASHGSDATFNASSNSRSRTRSADVPLSRKDTNASSTTSSFSLEKAPQPPFKKPYGLLRTTSARPSLLSSQSSSATLNKSNDSNNPFQVSPRPTAFLERAQSDSTLSFGGTFPKTTREGRKPSNLGREVSTTRPSLISYGSSTSQGRKISGR